MCCHDESPVSRALVPSSTCTDEYCQAVPVISVWLVVCCGVVPYTSNTWMPCVSGVDQCSMINARVIFITCFSLYMYVKRDGLIWWVYPYPQNIFFGNKLVPKKQNQRDIFQATVEAPRRVVSWGETIWPKTFVCGNTCFIFWIGSYQTNIQILV